MSESRTSEPLQLQQVVPQASAFLVRLFTETVLFTTRHVFWFTIIFLPWYVWALLFYPQVMLWWIATSAGLLMAAVAAMWPRSIIVWLPPAILCFNVLYHWLPWPSIKLTYLAPAAACGGMVIRLWQEGAERSEDEALLPMDFLLFLLCIVTSAVLSIISQFAFDEPAAWQELQAQLRIVPLLDEQMQYVPLRHMWVWALALGMFRVVYLQLRDEEDVRTALWSIHWATLPITLFGIYSYVTTSYMVSYYVFERRINATFSSPAVLADIYTAVFVSGFYLLKTSQTFRARFCAGALMLGQVVCLVLSGCRLNIAILVIMGVGWGCYRLTIARKMRRLLVGCGLALCVVLGAAAAWQAVPERQRGRIYALPLVEKAIRKVAAMPVVQRLNEAADGLESGASIQSTLLAGRWEHWNCAARMFKSSPLWGIGCGLFEQQYQHFRLNYDVFLYARAHNVFLRLLAEGGAVTITAFLVFIVLSVRRLLRVFKAEVIAANPEWAPCAQAFAAVFIALLLSSLSSDVLFENTEAVMFLTFVLACGTCAYRQLELPETAGHPWFERMIAPVRDGLRQLECKINWQSYGLPPMLRILARLPVLMLLVLIVIGVRGAVQQCRVKLGQGTLSYGFYSCASILPYKKDWRAVTKRAMTGMVFRQPVMYFRYRALNARMARLHLNLRLLIGGYPTATVPLSSTEERTLYCDVGALQGRWASIVFETERTFTPWKEAWFADSRTYGALVSGPLWGTPPASNFAARTAGEWNIRWSAYPDVYTQGALTNLVMLR